MRPIGFSTGALACSDFRRALAMLGCVQVDAIELSALRQPELIPMLDALGELDLTRFSYVSIHAPSQFDLSGERFAWERLCLELSRGWPIVAHPDALSEWTLWREFGPLLCIENMDKRKPIGRTARELDAIFRQVPDASLCFDIGHARQCDPTMTEAYLILREFGSKVRQVHVSEVNTRSKHDSLSYTSVLAFQEIAYLIPEEVPLILESPLQSDQLAGGIEAARRALPVAHSLAPA